MPYSSKDYKESNINYINKDFLTIKNSLINYAKGYFPDTYKDFNETSPGMMLIEMNAYVGDVLSFYIDQQYREMMLPLVEERKNIINIAKMLGYKVKPISPAYVDLEFTQIVNSVSGDESKVDYSTAGAFESGIAVTSVNNSNIVFETLQEVDFTISSSADTDVVSSTDSETGLVTSYLLKRKVKAISAETKTKIFTINKPSKFMKLNITNKNVIEIISVVDSNNNRWYEVEYLAQDKVPTFIPYWENLDRIESEGNENGSAYVDNTGFDMSTSVPYSLEYIRTNKRFMVETNTDNTTSLIFGNGLLRNGAPLDDQVLDMEQLGITIPGQTNNLNESINPMLGDDYQTLGEAPSQITLTVKYRVGGGLASNVSAGELTSFTSTDPLVGFGSLNSVKNIESAIGGKTNETIDEIRHNSRAFFTTQNRCVTKEDYEARLLNLPSKFGNIAKVYVTRAHDIPFYNRPQYETIQTNTEALSSLATTILNTITEYNDASIALQDLQESITNLVSNANAVAGSYQQILDGMESSPKGSIYIYILGYDRVKNLIGNPAAGDLGTISTDAVPKVLMQNINNYLEQYKILTDQIEIKDGYVINFGVEFDVVTHRFVNKKQVKLNCINLIKNYFTIDRMQFNQPIHISQLEYELMGIDGVRSINEVKIVQQINGVNLYRYSISSDGVQDNSVGENPAGTSGYGYKYDFSHSYPETVGGTNGVVLPPHPNNPAVFELKNPNQNIIGVVN